MSTISKRELERRLKGLAPEQAKSVACALIGHSKVVSMCFGYVSCGRCEAQIGDTLGGSSDLSNRVIIGHDCDTCRTNAMQLDWTDTFLVDEAQVFPDQTTICDCCGKEVRVAETQAGPPGEWLGATLCNDCYAEQRP